MKACQAKKSSQDWLDEVKQLESTGDALVQKETFDSCLSAVEVYLSAQELLFENANDPSIPDAKPWPAFNSIDVSYNALYSQLASKVTKANGLIADPRVARQ